PPHCQEFVERLARWDSASDRTRRSDDRQMVPSARCPDQRGSSAAVALHRLAIPSAGNDTRYRPACALAEIQVAGCGTEAARSYRSADATPLPSDRGARKDREDRIAPLERPARADAIVPVRRD